MGGLKKVSGEEEKMGNTSAPPLYCACSCFDHRAEPCGACPLNQGSLRASQPACSTFSGAGQEDGWGVSGVGGGLQEEIPEDDFSCYLLEMKKWEHKKNLSCKEKHSSSHEGNEIRGNCETQRFDQT